jgi:hypothetical protein
LASGEVRDLDHRWTRFASNAKIGERHESVFVNFFVGEIELVSNCLKLVCAQLGFVVCAKAGGQTIGLVMGLFKFISAKKSGFE